MVRLAVTGMTLAVVSLGGLAIWSTYTAQRQTDDLADSGVQIAGQLRAVQALSMIRIELRIMEDNGVADEPMARLRAAQELLPDGLARMRAGSAPEPAELARRAQSLAEKLDPAIEAYITDPRGDILYRGEDDDDTTEEALEVILQDLEIMLNRSGSDPAILLNDRLDSATATSDIVRRTAWVLVPLGLVGVAACGWLLGAYRRRSEALMRGVAESSALEARTDQLTGLPNRRALLEELERWIEGGRTFTVALADLNGFKHYNDTFGHPAGDALLRRLGGKLAVAWAGHGFAARLGGDEFCVITDNLSREALQEILHESLSEDGEGFSISAVSGLADVPAEAGDATAAMRLADTQLYAAKSTHYARRRGVGDASATAPSTRSTSAQMPDLGDRLDRVASLAVACARQLGLPAEEVGHIERAAQLHDIGKVAVPAAILSKREDLTAEEQEFLRHHSVIGERLLSGDESLEQAAAMVRAMQERWDGAGYPDQLAGDSIPVGARIIAVADAFCAMTTDRVRAPARTPAEALAELDRCSGTQFDPTVVAAVAEVVTRPVSLSAG